MRPTLLGIAAAVAAAGAAAAFAAQPPANGVQIVNPFRGVMQDRSAKSSDEALFVEKCGMCHRQMGMGTVLLARRRDPRTAMLESRRDLNAALIQAAVRRGIGNMPRIGRGELGDADLVRIIAHLTRQQ